MKKFILIFSISILLSSINDNYVQIRIYNTNQSIYLTLNNLGIDLDHIHKKKNAFIEFAIKESKLNQLRLNSIDYEVIIEDLEEHYSNRLDGNYTREFGLGSMGGYYTFDEAVQRLNEISSENSNIVSDMIALGTTLEGREIWALKISDNPNIDEDEPEVLYTGLHHAREPMSYMNLFYFMYWLVDNYNIDSEATTLINNREMWFIPMVNPDGLVYNYSIAPNGGGMQRKNMRQTCSFGGGQFGAPGIDLNRNYSFMWGLDDEGSSPDDCDETYRGTAPFSEPETQTIKEFVESRNFKIALNYHSYSNLLIHPFGYTYNSPISNEDLAIFTEYGNDMTQYNGYVVGAGPDILYTVNGEACDWMYGEEGIFAYTPEIGSYNDGFWPETDRIVPLAEENLYPNQFTAWVAGAKYAVNFNIIPGEDGFFVPGNGYYSEFEIFNQGLEDSWGDVNVELNISPSNGEWPSSFSENLGTIPSREYIVLNDVYTMIDSDISYGESITYTVNISDQSGYVFSESASITVGIPELNFFDGAEFGLNNWDDTGNWGLSQNSLSGLYSFSDSPNGDYQGDWSSSSITLRDPFDLSGVQSAYLEYDVNFEIEEGWDWCQVLVSTDNINWTSLNSDNMVSANGQGVQLDGYGYSGSSNGWIIDQVDLSSVAGSESVWVRFVMSSDGYVEEDGIYIDNFSVFSFESPEFIYGDLNNDQMIDVLDVVVMVNFVLDENYIESGDLNQDGILNVLDIVSIVNLILQGN